MEIKNSSQSPKPMPWSEDADYAIHFDPSTKPIPEDIHWVRVRATFWVELETSPNNVIVNYHDTLTLTGTLRLPSANLTLPPEITTWSATSLELDMTGFVQPGTSYYLGTSLPERSPRIVLTKVDKDGHELGTPKAYDVQLEQSWADPTMPFIGNVKGTVLVSQTALGKPDFLRVALFAWAQQGSTPDTAAWFRVGDRTTRVLTVLP